MSIVPTIKPFSSTILCLTAVFTIFGGMLLLTRCQSVSPHKRYLTEKNLIGQPEVSQEVMSRFTEVTLISFRSMLCGGIIGAR